MTFFILHRFSRSSILLSLGLQPICANRRHSCLYCLHGVNFESLTGFGKAAAVFPGSR